ncbi:MAG: tyrosine-type recombinase/integrase [Terriglobales bacterium]
MRTPQNSWMELSTARRYWRSRLGKNAFRKIWKAVCTRAGVPDLLFHDLRRSGVRNLRRLGVQESVVMRISGHKTRSVFERYNIVDEADLADAASRLDTKQNAAAVELTQTFGHDCGQLHQNCGRCADAACKCRSA